MWLIELVFKINIFITGRGDGFKNGKKTCIPVPSFEFSENRTCQCVVFVVCACIQNTIHLSIVLVLTFLVSKSIKFSLHVTNNIVPEVTKHPALEVRKKNVDLVFIYREVFSRQ